MARVATRARRGAAALLVAGATAGAPSCTITERQEVELGQQAAADVNRQLPIVRDAELQRFINALGRRIAAQGRRNLTYTFYIVNTDAVNAFSLPGGFVYVNRGLIERTANLAELAGVLAHEIAHVEERHGVEQVERLQRANLGLGLAYILLGRVPTGLERVAVQVGGAALFARYSRDAEREADATAVRLLVAAGIDPRGLVTFFEKLLAERRRRPTAIEQWFSTHPTTEERIAEVTELIRQIPPAQLRGLARESAEFRAFQARLRRLPPPPARFRAR